jgi:adenylate kinase
MDRTDYQIPHISTGDMFREAMASGSELGQPIKAIVNRGDLVSDELTCALVKERLSAPIAPKAIFSMASRARSPRPKLGRKSARRSAARSTSSSTSAAPMTNWSADFDPPGLPQMRRQLQRRLDEAEERGICDVCGSALIQRKDDNEASLKIRLANYYKSTAPLLDFYQEQWRSLYLRWDGGS